MKKSVILVIFSAFLVTGCTIGFLGGHRGGSIVIVPALPLMVEIDTDRYYYQNGYYYSYRGDVWFFSESRQGPWRRLPKSHYPREVRYRNHEGHDRHRNR